MPAEDVPLSVIVPFAATMQVTPFAVAVPTTGLNRFLPVLLNCGLMILPEAEPLKANCKTELSTKLIGAVFVSDVPVGKAEDDFRRLALRDFMIFSITLFKKIPPMLSV